MKVIGIVGRAYYNRDNQKIIQVNEAIRTILSSYLDVVLISLLPTNLKSYLDIKMGEDKIDIVEQKKLDFILDKCDGFIVPGGSSWYCFDEYVIKHAIEKKKPLLGICAGFQAICSMFSCDRDNFDMTKKVLNDSHYDINNIYAHQVILYNNTLLKNIIEQDKILVNSLHHNYIGGNLRNLIISSRSEDGIIESVELSNHPFFIGMQWHPEYLLDDVSKKIFNYFIKIVTNVYNNTSY